MFLASSIFIILADLVFYVLKKCSSLQSVVRTSVTPWCAQCNYYKDWQFSAM